MWGQSSSETLPPKIFQGLRFSGGHLGRLGDPGRFFSNGRASPGQREALGFLAPVSKIPKMCPRLRSQSPDKGAPSTWGSCQTISGYPPGPYRAPTSRPDLPGPSLVKALKKRLRRAAAALFFSAPRCIPEESPWSAPFSVLSDPRRDLPGLPPHARLCPVRAPLRAGPGWPAGTRGLGAAGSPRDTRLRGIARSRDDARSQCLPRPWQGFVPPGFERLRDTWKLRWVASRQLAFEGTRFSTMASLFGCLGGVVLSSSTPPQVKHTNIKPHSCQTELN